MRLLLLFVIRLRSIVHVDDMAKMFTFGATTLLPTLIKKPEMCKDDSDCPGMMKCCALANSYFCCKPDEYVYQPFVFDKNELKK